MHGVIAQKGFFSKENATIEIPFGIKPIININIPEDVQQNPACNNGTCKWFKPAIIIYINCTNTSNNIKWKNKSNVNHIESIQLLINKKCVGLQAIAQQD